MTQISIIITINDVFLYNYLIIRLFFLLKLKFFLVFNNPMLINFIFILKILYKL